MDVTVLVIACFGYGALFGYLAWREKNRAQ
jgi:hypothetical protein